MTTALPTPLSSLTSISLPIVATDITLVSRGGTLYKAEWSDLTPILPIPWTSITGTPTTVAGYGITDAVPTTRQVIAGTGMTGGGALSSNVTLSIDVTGVTAATYGSATQVAQVAVNARGQLTTASSITVTPAVGSITGFGAGVATALAIAIGSAGAPVVLNGALGTPSSGTLTSCTGLPISTGVSGLGANVATALAVAVGSAGAPVVLNGALGTPSSGTLTSCTGLPVSTGISGLGANVATALAVAVGSAGAFVTLNGALGTPSSGTLTSCTGLPISTGVSGLAANVATFLATPSSANLRAAMTDETGTGVLVFASGAIGTPTSGTLTSCTGLPISTGLTGAGTGVLTALAVNVGSAGAFVTFNGALGTPSSGTLTSCTGLPVAGGGTGAATFTTGGILLGNGTSAISALTTATAGLGLVSGASAAPTFQNNAVRAHINFDGTGTPAARGTPYNVTSITDNGTGDWTINYTSVLPSANYTFALSSQNIAATVVTTAQSVTTNPTTGALRILAFNAAIASAVDPVYVCATCIGG